MQTLEELKQRFPEYLKAVSQTRQPVPAPGQVWLTLDRREPRLVKVLAVNRDRGRQVQIEHQDNQRTTNASMERFRGKLGGYGFMLGLQPAAPEQVPTVHVPAKDQPAAALTHAFELFEHPQAPAQEHISPAQIRNLFARVNALENRERRRAALTRTLQRTLVANLEEVTIHG